MVETTGARGYHTAFEYFKPCEDLTLSFGVNVIDPHLSHESLAGCSKYDWPQTLSDHSPWWRIYHEQADHVARVNTALSQRPGDQPRAVVDAYDNGVEREHGHGIRRRYGRRGRAASERDQGIAD